MALSINFILDIIIFISIVLIIVIAVILLLLEILYKNQKKIEFHLKNSNSRQISLSTLIIFLFLTVVVCLSFSIGNGEDNQTNHILVYENENIEDFKFSELVTKIESRFDNVYIEEINVASIYFDDDLNITSIRFIFYAKKEDKLYRVEINKKIGKYLYKYTQTEIPESIELENNLTDINLIKDLYEGINYHLFTEEQMNNNDEMNKLILILYVNSSIVLNYNDEFGNYNVLININDDFREVYKYKLENEPYLKICGPFLINGRYSEYCIVRDKHPSVN